MEVIVRLRGDDTWRRARIGLFFPFVDAVPAMSGGIPQGCSSASALISTSLVPENVRYPPFEFFPDRVTRREEQGFGTAATSTLVCADAHDRDGGSKVTTNAFEGATIATFHRNQLGIPRLGCNHQRPRLRSLSLG